MKKSYLQKIDFYLLIPFYNNLPGLLHSLQSVQYDTDKYAVVIVDDGSVQPVTLDDLYKHISRDISIEIIQLPCNKGITIALNTGLQWIRQQNDALFVARLDCGDTCSPERFYHQVTFLKEHPPINLVGSWCIFKDHSTDIAFRYITPTRHKKIKRGMHFRNIFIHPTVMWRSDAMKDIPQYPDTFPDAEDYGFFYQLMQNGEVAIIPEYLVTTEINHKGISLSSRKKQLNSRIKVVKEYGRNRVLRYLGVLKLRLLLIIPYNLVFAMKRLLYGV
ncbi:MULTISPECIES: glycosyltransferase [Niastella]|uniref:Glycosyltransferase n=1 Tax=Niastella soli TaxID=2821487 RepID=A0ABS3YM84_9BACT|nr:glycosyltransferase [Niastella soli]MBO9199009.1 glycosyltransferase [Niastella soli]